MTKTYIITVSTHDKYYLPYLKKTCKKYGSELIILGYGEKWQGFNWRYKLVLNFLNKLNYDDIVCIIDGYDVICVRNLEQFSGSFLKLKNKYNCKIIVGEHKLVNNNYLNNYINSIYFGKCKNISLNAGTYVGCVKDLIEFIKNIQILNSDNMADDQILLTKYCNKNLEYIYIDINGELFVSLENKYKDIDNLFIFNNNNIYYNGYQPFFIHGPGETYLDNILVKMNIGYDINNKICDKLSKDYLNKQFFRIKNNYYLIFFLIFFIIFIIFIILFIVNRKKKIRKIK